MCAFNEIKVHIVGKDVGNYEDIVTSDTLADGEFTLTGLESSEFSVENIIVTCVAGVVGINVLGSLCTALSPGGKIVRNRFYQIIIGSVCNNADRAERCQCYRLIVFADFQVTHGNENSP